MTALYRGSCRLGQTVRGGLRDPIVHVPFEGATRYVFGQREILVAAGDAVFHVSYDVPARFADGRGKIVIDLK
jgi:hypothetical protein